MTQKDKEAVIAALEEYKGDSTGVIAATIEDCQRVVREVELEDTEAFSEERMEMSEQDIREYLHRMSEEAVLRSRKECFCLSVAADLLNTYAILLKRMACVIADYDCHDGWISIETRTPEPQKQVLTHRKSGYIDIELFENGEFTWDNGLEDVVTHWMPLPEPPKEARQYAEKS